MERRTRKNRAPNPTLEVLKHLYAAESLVGTLPTNDRAMIRLEFAKLKDTILKATKGNERRKVDRRVG